MAPKQTSKQAAEPERNIKVSVASISEKGFCRIGKQFTQTPEVVDVSQAELDILKANPRELIVAAVPPEETKNDVATDGSAKDTGGQG